MMSQMVEQLKKGHWIDPYSRMVSLHLQLSNANSGLFFTVRYMFELTAMKSVLPSFDIEVFLTNEYATEATARAHGRITPPRATSRPRAADEALQPEQPA